MSHRTHALVFFALLFSLTTSATVLAAPARDKAFEARVVDELRAVAPDAVPLFEQATTAADAEDSWTAARLYGEVATRAPSFSHAKRRQCSALLALDRRDEALPLCRAALAQDDSPENEAAMAAALLPK